MNHKINSVAPALPAAPVEYSKGYGDRLANILRLYFTKLDSSNAASRAAIEESRRYTLVMT